METKSDKIINPMLTKAQTRSIKAGSWVSVMVDWETDQREVGVVVDIKRGGAGRMPTYLVLLDSPVSVCQVSWDCLRGVGGLWSAKDAKGL